MRRTGGRSPQLLLGVAAALAVVLTGCTAGVSGTGAPATRATPPEACGDRGCEITVTGSGDLPVAPGSGVASARVASIGSDELTLVVEFEGGSVRTSCRGGCSVSNRSSGGASTTRAELADGAQLTANGVRVEVLRIDGPTAVLRVDAG